MGDMTTKSCDACHKGASPLCGEELQNMLGDIGDWQVLEVNNINRLQRAFKFKNFVKSLAFTNAIGEIAEEEGHHPTIITEWGKVTITWWTHKIGGLHQNDFIMAAKSDALYERQ